jgi:hypothetical protein
MDMTRHLRRWLNDKALNENFDGEYEGRIGDVTEETIRNRFTGQKQLEPVVIFEDGWRLLPNINQRRALIELMGADTEVWIGRRLCVFRHCTQKTDTETGLVKQTWEKRVRLPAAMSLRRGA